MNTYVARGQTWIGQQSALQRLELARARGGVPTYVGVVMVSAVVACGWLHVAIGIVAVALAWPLFAHLLRIHSDEIDERAWIEGAGSGWARPVHFSGLRDRIPRWLTRPPAAPTLIALFIGLLWVLVFFGNDISTKAQSYSSLALSSSSYQDAVAMTEPNVLGFVSAQPCYYGSFSQASWLFRLSPGDDLCYAVASLLDPTLTPRAVLLVGCTYLVVPVWWLVVVKAAIKSPHLGSERTN